MITDSCATVSGFYVGSGDLNLGHQVLFGKYIDPSPNWIPAPLNLASGQPMCEVPNVLGEIDL